MLGWGGTHRGPQNARNGQIWGNPDFCQKPMKKNENTYETRCILGVIRPWGNEFKRKSTLGACICVFWVKNAQKLSKIVKKGIFLNKFCWKRQEQAFSLLITQNCDELRKWASFMSFTSVVGGVRGKKMAQNGQKWVFWSFLEENCICLKTCCAVLW